MEEKVPISRPLKGTRTEKNLATAFAGECMARNRYTFFASRARKQGYMQIAEIFEETAMNECQHAKTFLNLMNEEGVEPNQVTIQLVIPAVNIGETLENLRTAAKGENEEHTIGYPHMAAIAEQEGFAEIAKTFRKVAEVEREHEIRFTVVADQLENGTLYKKEKIIKWKCRNCGNVIEAEQAPEVCPVCGYATGFFEIKEVLE